MRSAELAPCAPYVILVVNAIFVHLTFDREKVLYAHVVTRGIVESQGLDDAGLHATGGERPSCRKTDHRPHTEKEIAQDGESTSV